MFAEPLKGHCCPAQVTRDVCYLIKVLVLASMRWFADWEIMGSLLPIFLCNLHCSITSKGTITPKWRSRQGASLEADPSGRRGEGLHCSKFLLTEGGLWPEVDVNVACNARIIALRCVLVDNSPVLSTGVSPGLRKNYMYALYVTCSLLLAQAKGNQLLAAFHMT